MSDQQTSYLDDMEEELDRDRSSERSSELFDQLAAMLIADDQLENRGELLGHFAPNKKIMFIVISILGLLAAIMFVLWVKIAFIYFFLFMLSLGAMIIWGIICKKRLEIYIDIYEKAIVGRAESNYNKKMENISRGIAYIDRALAARGILYLVMFDEKEIYRFKYLENANQISYMINRRIAQTRGLQNREEVL
ncbi:MAG: hypothetical protein K2N80_12945 [Lachnospiraceae bacterium]|nr:hypothetical protein [Lachnospiraceae bacterium]